MTGARWGGSRSTKARAYVRTMLPCPCWRCGRIITPEMPWVAGHIVSRHDGGTDDPHNLRPEHRRCSDSSGGRVGGRITAARKNSTLIEKNGLGW